MGVVVAFSQPASALRRIPLIRRCVVRRPEGEAAGVVCNLSVGGTYVAIQPAPGVGEKVHVFLELPWREQLMAIEAVVCWDNSARRAPGLPPGCGLEFLAPSWDDRSRIEALVRSFRPRR